MSAGIAIPNWPKRFGGQIVVDSTSIGATTVLETGIAVIAVIELTVTEFAALESSAALRTGYVLPPGFTATAANSFSNL